MLTYDECVGMSGATEDEIAAIAEHQRLPLMVAAGLAQVLLKSPKGKYVLRSYICDLLAQAKVAGRSDDAKRLDRILTDFNVRYPIPSVLRT